MLMIMMCISLLKPWLEKAARVGRTFEELQEDL